MGDSLEKAIKPSRKRFQNHRRDDTAQLRKRNRFLQTQHHGLDAWKLTTARFWTHVCQNHLIKTYMVCQVPEQGITLFSIICIRFKFKSLIRAHLLCWFTLRF